MRCAGKTEQVEAQINREDDIMKQLGYIGLDQYGRHFTIDKHPRKELMNQLHYKSAQKMYCDTTDGRVKHTGYIVGPHWISVYCICEWKEAV